MPLLRLSVYSRLAGYKDANDAEGLASDPARQAVVDHRATPGNPCPVERQGATGDRKGSIIGRAHLASNSSSV